MLKLTYTEGNFDLECLTHSLEEWVAQRAIFALRVGQSICVQPSTASFLLPVDLPGVEILKDGVKREHSEIMTVSTCDPEYVEVTLRGSWLSSCAEDAVGVFVTTMGNSSAGDSCPLCIEFFLHQLWQESQASSASVMSE
jgi:hypothetical protein